VLAGLPDGPWRRQQELDLLVALTPALNATKGWATPEVAETLARARALAEQLDRPDYLVPLLRSQWAFHFTRAEHRLALALVEQLEKIGEVRNDATAQLQATYTHGASRLYLGEFVAARAVLERGIGLVDPAHRAIGGSSVDPYAGLLTYDALTLACLGHIDQARSRIDEALSDVRRLRNPHTLAFVLTNAAWFDWLTCLPMVHVEEMLAITTKHGFSRYLGSALTFRGQSLIALGQAQEGLALLTQGLSKLSAEATNRPAFFTWLAEAHALLGQPAEARNCLAEAARIVETTDERFLEAELLHRVPGDLLNATGDRSGAERHYRQAIAVAERQSAKLFQLRASTSLARLWRDQDRRAEAYDLLAPIYNWFTEGFDAPVLKEAKALLDELA
jgi:tetratricopeptide (TPR) repeat protein